MDRDRGAGLGAAGFGPGFGDGDADARCSWGAGASERSGVVSAGRSLGSVVSAAAAAGLLGAVFADALALGAGGVVGFASTGAVVVGGVEGVLSPCGSFAARGAGFAGRAPGLGAAFRGVCSEGAALPD